MIACSLSSLLFQGDIEAVAAKSPQGLTTLFEQISGSDVLRVRFNELVRTKSQAEEKVRPRNLLPRTMNRIAGNSAIIESLQA